MGTFTQVHFLWKNGTFTSLLWAMLLSLLYLNAIQVKNASIYSKCAIYFSLANERCPFANDSFFWVNSVQRLDQTSWQTIESVRKSVWMIRSVPQSSEAVLTQSCNMKSIEHVALDLQSIESKSAKLLFASYEDLY